MVQLDCGWKNNKPGGWVCRLLHELKMCVYMIVPQLKDGLGHLRIESQMCGLMVEKKREEMSSHLCGN